MVKVETTNFSITTTTIITTSFSKWTISSLSASLPHTIIVIKVVKVESNITNITTTIIAKVDKVEWHGS